jgi:hypothetical protein
VHHLNDEGGQMELTAEDRLAIIDLCGRACHALDFNDPDGFARLFVPDGAFQRRASPRAGGQVIFRHEGREQLRAFASSMGAMRAGLARHWTANIVVHATGALGTSYTMLVANDAESRAVSIAIAGSYQDVFEKTGDGWLFASRTVVDDL